MSYIETDYTQLQNFVELPKSSLKWDGETPYIVHKRQVHRAKKLVVGGNTYYEVKKPHSRWLIRIA